MKTFAVDGISSLIPRFPTSLGTRPLYFLIIHTALRLQHLIIRAFALCYCASVCVHHAVILVQLALPLVVMTSNQDACFHAEGLPYSEVQLHS